MNGSVGLSTFISGGTENTSITQANLPSVDFDVTVAITPTLNSNEPPLCAASGALYGYLNEGASGNAVFEVGFEKITSGVTVASGGSITGHNHPLQSLMYLDSIICTKN